MYLVGAPHRHKVEAQILLERLVAEGWPLVTDEMTTLEERIGTPLRSRLYEMCKKVVIDGEDYRKRLQAAP